MISVRGCLVLSFASALAFPFVLGAQTDADLLSHGKVLKLLKNKRGLAVPGMIEATPNLEWLSSYLSERPIAYSLDNAILTQTYVLFPAANTQTRERYLFVAFPDSRSVIGIHPDGDRNTVRLFDVTSNRSIEVSPFEDANNIAAAPVSGPRTVRQSATPAIGQPATDVYGTATCVWNLITSGLSNYFGGRSWGWSDIAGLVCNFRSANDDVKQMIDLGKSIGGCAVASWFDCVNAGVEIGLLAGNQSCRPDWMNTCFATGSSGEFSIQATPLSQNVVQGQSAVFTVTATFTGGFNTPISGFSVSNLQPGASARFTAQSIANVSEATQLIITTTSTATVQDRVLTITASSGGKTHTTTVELNINPAPAGGGSGGALTNGQSVSGSLAAGQQSNYKITVPSGSAQLLVNMTGSGDADLYVKYGSAPTLPNWDCRPYTSTANEQCLINNPQAGDWFIMVNGYSSSSTYTLSATYSGGGGGGGVLPAPHVTDVNPKTAPVGVDTVFTITGTGFQQGFSGNLWVGSSSFPVNPGAQTIWLNNSNQVQLVVKVGAIGSQTTSFGLQIVNPDQQASAIYTGLSALAAGGGGGVATGNVQVTFTPSSVSRDGGDGKFYFSVNLQETNGVGVTLVGLSAGGTDYTSNIASWFGSNRLPANGQLSVGMNTTCSSPCNYIYPWMFTGNDDNGHNGLTWSGSVFLGQ